MSSTSVTERVQVSGSSWNPKVACAVALLLVFLCGAAAGALVMDFGVHRTRIPSFETPAGKALYFERMQRELNLTPQQSEQMQSVLNDFWQYYRTVLSDGKQRVEALLNDEQRAKFEKMLQQQLPR
jgi:ribose/xylose/arabinose/galactoside ABC-type transport system permease subunit